MHKNASLGVFVSRKEARRKRLGGPKLSDIKQG
jgi:hypothetical protein